MKNSFVVSDTHFAHTNIIKYSKRPFASVLEHDEQLIKNWNDHVKQGDDVFFLGDFVYGNKSSAITYRRRLNGNIFFIEGNHDSAAWQIRTEFAWYDTVKMVEINGQKIWLSHYAHRVWDRSHHGVWHLYAHSHASLPDDPNSLSFDVGVDNTAIRLSGSSLYGTGTIPDDGLKPEDYRPIHFDEIAAVMARKNFKPIDHHGKR